MLTQLTPKERLGYLALGVILLAIIGVLGYRSGAHQQNISSTLPSPSSVAPNSPPAAPPLLVVDVSGEVKNPGVYRLTSDSRAVDAVKAAGGPSANADLNSLNLAEKLTDGEQIQVPAKADASASSVTGAAPTVSGGRNGKIISGTISLNSASLQELEELPDVGPTTAQKILDWRTAHGRFSKVDQLKEVGGIGDKKLARIAPFVKI